MYELKNFLILFASAAILRRLCYRSLWSCFVLSMSRHRLPSAVDRVRPLGCNQSWGPVSLAYQPVSDHFFAQRLLWRLAWRNLRRIRRNTAALIYSYACNDAIRGSGSSGILVLCTQQGLQIMLANWIDQSLRLKPFVVFTAIKRLQTK